MLNDLPRTPPCEIVAPAYSTLTLTFEAPVAVVTLNRPEVMNALNAQTFTDLHEAFTLLTADPTIRVILLTGAGAKAFAAGADINELARTDAASGEALSLRGQAVFTEIETCGKPVLACINGFALGGGCELAMACTLRIAAESARLGQPEVKLGLIPGYGGTQRLPRLVGPSAALRLLLTGAMISAEEAFRMGLVDLVVAPDDLMDVARAMAAQMTELAPLALAACMRAVQQGAALPLDQALALEARIFGSLNDSSDKKEGVDAFLTKRKPRFTGQ